MPTRTPAYLLRRWYLAATVAIDALALVAAAPFVSYLIVWMALTIAYLIVAAASLRGSVS